jgi:hypothetical protein
VAEDEELMCCGEPLSWLVAESVRGSWHALGVGRVGTLWAWAEGFPSGSGVARDVNA